MGTTDNRRLLQFAVNLGEYWLYLDSRCIGSTLKFRVDNHDMELLFPDFEFINDVDFTLLELTKSGFRELKPGGFYRPYFRNAQVDPTIYGEHTWGLEGFGTRTGNSSESENNTLGGFQVERLFVRSIDSVREDEAENLILRTMQNLLGMIRWVEVITFVDCTRELSRESKQISEQPHFIDSHGLLEPFQGPTTDITVFYWEQRATGIESLELALQLASKGKKVDPLHAFLHSALRHQNSDNYRGAVLDTATAIEVGLTRLMEEHLKSYGEALSDVYFSARPTPRRLCEDIKRLTGSWPLSIKLLETRISLPRNRAIHRGEVVTREESYEALIFAKEFIYERFPPAEEDGPVISM